MRRFFFLAFLSFLALPLTSGAQVPDDIRVENGLVDAVTLIEEGQIGKALLKLDSLATLHPDNDAIQYYIGLCKYSMRDVNAAVSALEKAASLDSTNTWYKESLASAYLASGDAARAGDIYLELSKLNPRKFKNAYTLTLMADSYRLQRDYQAFFNTLKDFVKDQSVPAETKSKYLSSALSNFDGRTLRTIIPHIDTLTVAFIEAEPKSVEAHKLRLEIANYIGDWHTELNEARACMELQSGDTSAVVTYLAIIGDIYYQAGDRRNAFRSYEQALKLDPKYCPVLNNYAYYLSTLKRNLKKAAKMSAITVELKPDEATYLDTYGWILYLLHKPKEAKPYFKHAMLYGGRDNAVVLEHYALVLEALGEKELAQYYHGLAEAKKGK